MIKSQWTIDNEHLQEVKNEKQPEKLIKESKKHQQKISFKTISVNQPFTDFSFDIDSFVKGILASTKNPVTLSDKVLKESFPFIAGAMAVTQEDCIAICKQYGVDPSDVKSISVSVSTNSDDGTNLHKVTFEKYVY